MGFDVLIKNARICDGTGAPTFHGAVAINEGKIVEVGNVSGSARREIDAEGLVLAPGFVDHHTHYDAQISWDPLLTSSCWHGVTSVVMGNCGVGVAPCRANERGIVAWDLVNVEAMPYEVLLNGVAWEWESFPEYLAAIGKRQLGINAGFLVPLSALRFFVLGEESSERAARPDEVRLRLRVGTEVEVQPRDAVLVGRIARRSPQVAKQHVAACRAAHLNAPDAPLDRPRRQG